METHEIQGYEFRLWVGLLGGATAWFIRFLLVYGVSEWRCTGMGEETYFFGIASTAWILLGITLLLVAFAIWSVLVARATLRAVHARNEARGASLFMARTGIFLSGLFAFIMIVESIPILFLGRLC